ncbi:MAG TPA: hypothetical protein VIK98_04365, partial [Limnochordales bacterium]
MRTAYEALKICSPMFVMSFSFFVRQDLLTSPGWPQIFESLVVGVACLALTFTTFGRFSKERWADAAGRGALLVLSLVAMFYPAQSIAALAAAVALVLLIKGVFNFRIIAPPVVQPVRPAV